MVNRCVVIIKAKEPFLKWLKGLPDPGNFTLDEVNNDTSAYLLPNYEDDPKAGRILSRYFGLIFDEQLSAWWTNERDCRSNRDLRVMGSRLANQHIAGLLTSHTIIPCEESIEFVGFVGFVGLENSDA